MGRQIGANRAIAIDSQADTDGESIGKSNGVHRIESRGDELTAARCWLAEYGLNRLTCVIRVAHYAAWKGRPAGVLTPFDLRADLHLVIDSEKCAVVAEAGCHCLPFQSAGTEALRA